MNHESTAPTVEWKGERMRERRDERGVEKEKEGGTAQGESAVIV